MNPDQSKTLECSETKSEELSSAVGRFVPESNVPTAAPQQEVSRRSRFRVATEVLVILTILAGLIAGRSCGSYLVVNNGERSDVVFVPAGGLQQRYDKALDLLRQGYAERMVADIRAGSHFGLSTMKMASNYFETQSDISSRIHLCSIKAGTSESIQAADCLRELRPKSVLIVTGEFQTRRALLNFSHDMPRYRWSVMPVQPKRSFPVKWWTRKNLAKSVFFEWTRLLWWEFVERWEPSKGLEQNCPTSITTMIARS